MRSCLDVWSSNLSPMVDKMVGSAFLTVKTVADNIQSILYVATNIQAIITVAQQYAALGADTSLLTTVPTVLRTVDGATINALPDAADRADKFLSFDDLGQPALVPRTTDNVVENLTITDTNILSNITHTYTGGYAMLFLDTGQVFLANMPNSPVAINGSVVTWNPSNAGNITLNPLSNKVTIFYSAAPGN